MVEDVDWNRFAPEIFGSVGDDGQLLIWDARDAASGTPKHAVPRAHGDKEVSYLLHSLCAQS